MASGDLLIDSTGALVLDPDGNLMIHDGVTDSCCCGAPPPPNPPECCKSLRGTCCFDKANGKIRFTFSGSHQWQDPEASDCTGAISHTVAMTASGTVAFDNIEGFPCGEIDQQGSSDFPTNPFAEFLATATLDGSPIRVFPFSPIIGELYISSLRVLIGYEQSVANNWLVEVTVAYSNDLGLAVTGGGGGAIDFHNCKVTDSSNGVQVPGNCTGSSFVCGECSAGTFHPSEQGYAARIDYALDWQVVDNYCCKDAFGNCTTSSTPITSADSACLLSP